MKTLLVFLFTVSSTWAFTYKDPSKECDNHVEVFNQTVGDLVGFYGDYMERFISYEKKLFEKGKLKEKDLVAYNPAIARGGGDDDTPGGWDVDNDDSRIANPRAIAFRNNARGGGDDDTPGGWDVDNDDSRIANPRAIAFRNNARGGGGDDTPGGWDVDNDDSRIANPRSIASIINTSYGGDDTPGGWDVDNDDSRRLQTDLIDPFSDPYIRRIFTQ